MVFLNFEGAREGSKEVKKPPPLMKIITKSKQFV